jgi:hypothetical protein
MTATVTTQFVQQFDASLRTAVQQQDSRLMKTVTDRGTIEGATFTINNLGALGLLDENVQRHGDTLWSEIEHSARVAAMRDYFKALPLDRADIPKMKVNPITGGQYMGQLIAARNRRIDQIIYQALLGNITTVDGSTTYSLPNTQKIVGGGTGLTKAKIIQARAIFRSNEADDLNGQELFMLYNSVALGQILSDTTLTSADFLAGQMLQSGSLAGSWLGFKWIPYEGLNNATGVYSTVAYTKEAVHFGKAYEEGNVAVRPDKKNTTQVSIASSYGAGRQDEKKVVQIDFQ